MDLTAPQLAITTTSWTRPLGQVREVKARLAITTTSWAPLLATDQSLSGSLKP